MWFATYFVGTILQQWGKTWTREVQSPVREAITGSNKGIELHSTEAIFGTSLPLAVHLFSLAHRNREGALRLQSMRSHPSPLSLLAISHYKYCIVYVLQMQAEMVKLKSCGLPESC